MPQKNRIFAIFKSQSIRQAPTKIPEEPKKSSPVFDTSCCTRQSLPIFPGDAFRDPDGMHPQ